MSGRTSQRKGRAGELELTRILQAHGYDVQPGQAVRDADHFLDGAPTVFHRRNRSNWMVTMRSPCTTKQKPLSPAAGTAANAQYRR